MLQPREEVHFGGIRSPPVAVNGHVVLVRVLVLLVASVEQALDVAASLGLVVHARLREILRQPAAGDEQPALLAVLVEVRVEGRNDFEAFFACSRSGEGARTVSVLWDAELGRVVEDAANAHGLEAPVALDFLN